MKQNLYNKKGIIVFILFLLSMTLSKAQYDNSLYYNFRDINPADSQKLFLSIDNTNFMNNNEFFGSFVDGYTLIGFHLTPEIIYYPTSKVRLKAGVHLLKYYGLESFTSAIPTFSFQYNLTPSLLLVFGSLYGTANHKLIEPVYEFERYFIKNHESGIQFLLNTGYFKSDTWLNWEKFILEGDPFQEEFTIGTSNIFYLSSPDAKIKLSIPFQALASHKGGQINTSDADLQTILNSASGISVKRLFSDSDFRFIEFSSFLLTFNDLSHTKRLPFQKGWANYSNIITEWKSLTIGAGYWYGNQYITKRGRPVFQSVSVKDPLYFEEIRQLITSKIMLNKRIGKVIKFGLKVETYYDLVNKKLDYTYGIHIIYNQRFFLKKSGSAM